MYVGPDIVDDGLVFLVSPGSERSYPGTGTSVTDLMGTGNGVLLNGVGFNTADKVWEFDGVDDGIKFQPGINTSVYNAITITGWLYITTGGTWYRWFSGASGVSFHYPDLAILADGDIGFYHGSLTTGWVDTNQSIGLDTWALVSCVFKNNGEVKIYINNEIVYSNTFTSGTLPTNFNFMVGNRYDLNGEAIVGEIGPVSLYSKELTSTEVSQNYNALKSRFGL